MARGGGRLHRAPTLTSVNHLRSHHTFDEDFDTFDEVAEDSNLVLLPSRRGSLLCAALDDDDEDTRERLAKNMSIAANTLDQEAAIQANEHAAEGWWQFVAEGFWMPIMMVATGTLLLVLPVRSWLIEDVGLDHRDMSEANDPVGAFLSVTALVYALIFASAYGEEQARMDEIRCSLIEEANSVHTAMLLVRSLAADNEVHKVRALLLFASYIFQLGDEVKLNEVKADEEKTKRGATTDSEDPVRAANTETLFAAVPHLDAVCQDCDSEMQRILVQRTIDMLDKVSEARSIRETATHDSLSWMTSLFLLEMGAVTMFGVCMLQTGSDALDLTLQLLTLVCLASSEALLADLALPFSGIVQVDRSIFFRIQRSISGVLVATQAQLAGDSDRKSRSTRGSSFRYPSNRASARNSNIRARSDMRRTEHGFQPAARHTHFKEPPATTADTVRSPTARAKPRNAPSPTRGRGRAGGARSSINIDIDEHMQQAAACCRRMSVDLQAVHGLQSLLNGEDTAGSPPTRRPHATTDSLSRSETWPRIGSESPTAREKAATKIEAHARGFIVRAYLKTMIGAVLVVQRFIARRHKIRSKTHHQSRAH